MGGPGCYRTLWVRGCVFFTLCFPGPSRSRGVLRLCWHSKCPGNFWLLKGEFPGVWGFCPSFSLLNTISDHLVLPE